MNNGTRISVGRSGGIWGRAQAVVLLAAVAMLGLVPTSRAAPVADALGYVDALADNIGVDISASLNVDNVGGALAASAQDARIVTKCITLPGATFTGWSFIDLQIAGGGELSAAALLTVQDCAPTPALLTTASLADGCNEADLSGISGSGIRLVIDLKHTSSAGPFARVTGLRAFGYATGVAGFGVSPTLTATDSGQSVTFNLALTADGAALIDPVITIDLDAVNADRTLIEDGTDAITGATTRPIEYQAASSGPNGEVPATPSAGASTGAVIWSLDQVAGGFSGSLTFSAIIPSGYIDGRTVAISADLDHGATSCGGSFDNRIATSANSKAQPITVSSYYSISPSGYSGYGAVGLGGPALISDGHRIQNPAPPSGSDRSDLEDITVRIAFDTRSCVPIYDHYTINWGPTPSAWRQITEVSVPAAGTQPTGPLELKIRRLAFTQDTYVYVYYRVPDASKCSEGEVVGSHATLWQTGTPAWSAGGTNFGHTIQTSVCHYAYPYTPMRVESGGVVINNFGVVGGWPEQYMGTSGSIGEGDYLTQWLPYGGGSLRAHTVTVDKTYWLGTLPQHYTLHGVHSRGWASAVYKDCKGTALLPTDPSFLGGDGQPDEIGAGWDPIDTAWSTPYADPPSDTNPRAVVPAGCRILTVKANDNPAGVAPDYGSLATAMVIKACDAAAESAGRCVVPATEAVIDKVSDGHSYSFYQGTVTDCGARAGFAGRHYFVGASWPKVYFDATSNQVPAGTSAALTITPHNRVEASRRVDGIWAVNFFDARGDLDLQAVTGTVIPMADLPGGVGAAQILAETAFHPPNADQCALATDANDAACFGWFEGTENTQIPNVWGKRDPSQYTLDGFAESYRLNVAAPILRTTPAGTIIPFEAHVTRYTETAASCASDLDCSGQTRCATLSGKCIAIGGPLLTDVGGSCAQDGDCAVGDVLPTGRRCDTSRGVCVDIALGANNVVDHLERCDVQSGQAFPGDCIVRHRCLTECQASLNIEVLEVPQIELSKSAPAAWPTGVFTSNIDLVNLGNAPQAAWYVVDRLPVAGLNGSDFSPAFGQFLVSRPDVIVEYSTNTTCDSALLESLSGWTAMPLQVSARGGFSSETVNDIPAAAACVRLRAQSGVGSLDPGEVVLAAIDLEIPQGQTNGSAIFNVATAGAATAFGASVAVSPVSAPAARTEVNNTFIMGLSKAFTADVARPGEIDWELRYFNDSGTLDPDGVTVIDCLPVELVLENVILGAGQSCADLGCALRAPTVDCPGGELWIDVGPLTANDGSPGGTDEGVVTVTTSVAPGTAAGTALTNEAEVVPLNPQGVGSAASSSTVQSLVSLAVAVAAVPPNGVTPATTIDGAAVRYTLTVTNQNTSGSRFVTIRDVLPAEFSFIPGTFKVNGATAADAFITGAGGAQVLVYGHSTALGAGQALTVTLDGTIDTGGTVATVDSAGSLKACSSVDVATSCDAPVSSNTAVLAVTVCGDGVAEGAEDCDTGGGVGSGDGCTASCALQPGYECKNAGCTVVGDIDECQSGDDNCDPNATCSNTVGSFSCACDGGYSGDGTSCSDIDECAADPCDANATCANTSGSFSCTCDGGYAGDGISCADINECEAADACDPNATCTNAVGSFSCACDAGFSGDGATCVDDDECADGTNNCANDATCTNTAGGFGCACNSGYSGDGVTCVDIDECADSADNCSADGTCTNTPGGFDCACNSGYAGDGVSCTDIDECGDGSNNCSANAACTNTPGGFDCTCGDGYAGDGVSCTDIDECGDGSNNCSANAACTNTDGGFTCACASGYSGDGVACDDVDECGDGTHNCSANAACTNTPGGFGCACDSGYTGDGVTCTDIDECTDGSNNCSADATCTNTDGGFGCACDSGYVGDGVTCVDVDECAQPDACDPNAACTNAVGTYACACNSGYSGDGSSCVDINECDAPDACDPNAACANTPGAFTCTCGSGYSGDGATCVDVNECDAPDACDPNATCTNTVGDYECACDAGFSGDGATCVDIDECGTGADNCDANAACTNTAGGFLCSCDSGYAGDGTACTDIDECVAGVGGGGGAPCDANAACENTLGGFTCTCGFGFSGDGATCSQWDCADLEDGWVMDPEYPCGEGTCGSFTSVATCQGGVQVDNCDAAYAAIPDTTCTPVGYVVLYAIVYNSAAPVGTVRCFQDEGGQVGCDEDAPGSGVAKVYDGLYCPGVTP